MIAKISLWKYDLRVNFFQGYKAWNEITEHLFRGAFDMRNCVEEIQCDIFMPNFLERWNSQRGKKWKTYVCLFISQENQSSTSAPELKERLFVGHKFHAHYFLKYCHWLPLCDVTKILYFFMWLWV